jgi:hypothetical protein
MDSRIGEEAPAARKTQLNRRLGLSARKGQGFDPKVFEARGRELQGQFYEIGTPANPTQHTGMPVNSGSEVLIQRKSQRQWLFWVGMAGVAGASAGAVGFVLMSKAHPAGAPPPKDLVLTDDQ